ncbi:MAG TPA: hypothetical protein VKA68_11595 [bacterium]|nr:hypothetical protein [bacterium]
MSLADPINIGKDGTTIHLTLPAPGESTYQVEQAEDQEVMISAVSSVVTDTAIAALGATITTSSEEEYTIDDTGRILSNDGKLNSQAFDWVIIDFHKERLVRKISFTVRSNGQPIDYVLKIWGGNIFFPTSPQVTGVLNFNGHSVQTFTRRFPEQRTQKILLEFGTANDKGNFTQDKSVIIETLRIESLSVPSEITVQIGDQQPFFQHPGELSLAQEIPLPDFSEQINTFLQESDPEEAKGQLLVPMTIHSATEGKFLFRRKRNNERLPVTEQLVEFGYRLQGNITQFSILPGENKLFEERNYTFTGTNQHTVSVVNPGVPLSDASFHLTGQLAAERLLLSNLPDDSRFAALGSGTFQLAQRLTFEHPVRLSAAELRLELLTDQAELSLDIQPDFNNQPSNNPVTDSSVQLQISKNELHTEEQEKLIKLSFPTPLALEEAQYWMVLSVSGGEVTWRINHESSNPGGFLYTRTDQTQSWKKRVQPSTNKPVSGLFNIYAAPENAAELLEIWVGEYCGLVPQIQESQAIDTEVNTLQVTGEERSLTELLNAMISEKPDGGRIPIRFRARSSGELRLSDLLMRFYEEHSTPEAVSM